MNKFKLSYIFTVILLGAVITILSSCGGSSDSGDLVIRGSLQTGVARTTLNLETEAPDLDDVNNIAGAEVCTFGSCTMSGPDGRFRIEIDFPNDNNQFPGGDIPMTFTFNDSTRDTLLSGVAPGTNDLDVDFYFFDEDEVEKIVAVLNNTSTAPAPTEDAPADGENNTEEGDGGDTTNEGDTGDDTETTTPEDGGDVNLDVPLFATGPVNVSNDGCGVGNYNVASGPGDTLTFSNFGDNSPFDAFFFPPDQFGVEDLLKILGAGNHSCFWVFAAATTNVEVTLTVTCTNTDGGFCQTDGVFSNPLCSPAEAITDTEAFATCP